MCIRDSPIALLPRPPPPPSGSSRALSRARAAWSAAANLEIYETTLIHELHIDQIRILTVYLEDVTLKSEKALFISAMRIHKSFKKMQPFS